MAEVLPLHLHTLRRRSIKSYGAIDRLVNVNAVAVLLPLLASAV
jgi:hypothetical protein